MLLAAVVAGAVVRKRGNADTMSLRWMTSAESGWLWWRDTDLLDFKRDMDTACHGYIFTFLWFKNAC